MPGAESLEGLIYQQRWIYFRVLSELATESLGGDSSAAAISGFSVEGWLNDDGPVWDVVVEYDDGRVDLVECKDTAIGKEDRRTFYKRIRKEIVAGFNPSKFHPTWVTDPDKQPPNSLTHLEGIAQTVDSLSGFPSFNASWKYVTSIERAVQEALDCLCDFSASNQKTELGAAIETVPKLRPLTFDEAKLVLKNLTVARHRFMDFEQPIKQLAIGVFTTGTPDSVKQFVTGLLSNAITEVGRAKFNVSEFREQIGAIIIQADLADRIRDLFIQGSGSGLLPKIRRVRWSHIRATPETTWTLTDRLPTYDIRKCACVVAAMGVGKTVASQMAIERASDSFGNGKTLRFEARSLDRDDLRSMLRLVCVLCGTGPTWIAIDGLDEVRHDLRDEWRTTLAAIESLDNVTLFVTVRREVLIVQDWLADTVVGLPRLEMDRLTAEQVKHAFTAVGLPAPVNRRLIEILRNPLLLSLYASFVSVDDMPLAQSGEATAYSVIDEFWKRRVRGGSIGLRLDGEEKAAIERKRKAARYLANQSLGETRVLTRSDDPDTSSGIEMLLREGVVLEYGLDAVVWIHDWLREYAIVEALRGGTTDATAIAFAKQIDVNLLPDAVARSAAAGGMKWVLSDPSVGTAPGFLQNVWDVNQGAARDAMIVLLESPCLPSSLGQLSDALLVEFTTFAVSLGVSHWQSEIVGLGESRFDSVCGDDLHSIVVDYELNTCCVEALPSRSTLERLLLRDVRRCRAGKPRRIRTFRLLIEKAVAGYSLNSGVIRDWLRYVSTVSGQQTLGEICKAIASLSDRNHIDLANEMLRAAMRLDVESEDGQELLSSIASSQNLYGSDCINLLSRPKLLSNHFVPCGETAVDLLAALIVAKQKSDWPHDVRFFQSMIAESDEPNYGEEVFAARFDQDARLTTLRDRQDNEHPVLEIAFAIEQCAKTYLDDATDLKYRKLLNKCITAKFAAIIVIPVLALLDSLNSSGSQVWHEGVAEHLLTDADILESSALQDSRRLLRQALLTRTSSDRSERLAVRLRLADISQDTKLQELSDFDAVHLTASERAQIAKAKTYGLPASRDPRTEPLFRSGRAPNTSISEPKSDWPYDEDAASLKACDDLRFGKLNESDFKSDSDPKFVELLRTFSRAIDRPEATEARWFGVMLAKASSIVALAKTMMCRDISDEDQPIQNERWHQFLKAKLPWWTTWTSLAMDRLADAVPESHHMKDAGNSLSWSPNDEFYNSVELLNRLLYIPRKQPFFDLQQKFGETIRENWQNWPSYSRASLLLELNPWFFAHVPSLRHLLTTVSKTEVSPHVVKYAMGHVACTNSGSVPQEFELLFQRADSEKFHKSFFKVGEWLGLQLIPSLGTPGDEPVSVTAEVLNDWLERPWRSDDLFRAFASGVLDGARDSLVLHKESKASVYQNWLDVVSTVIPQWRFAGTDDDTKDFPIVAIWGVLSTSE